MKKAIGMFVALILALGMSGIAYAHWSKIITISGTVNTGSLHLTPSFHIENLDQDKDVAKVTWSVDNETNTLTVTMDNVYPCLTVSGYIDLHNDGTIPAGLHDIIFTSNPTLRIEYSSITDGYEADVYDDSVSAVDPIATGEVTFRGDFEQIDPCDTVYADWWIHFEENLPQSTTYTFMIQLVYYNWNEA